MSTRKYILVCGLALLVHGVITVAAFFYMIHIISGNIGLFITLQ